MTDWRSMLGAAAEQSPPMEPQTAARMRETIVRAARAAAVAPSPWGMRFALAGFAAIVFALSTLATSRPAPPVDSGVAARPERRQIQFATPGGTRIIWEINPNFTFPEAIP